MCFCILGNKPNNVMLDVDFRAKVSDFDLLRIKIENRCEHGVDLFS